MRKLAWTMVTGSTMALAALAFVQTADAQEAKQPGRDAAPKPATERDRAQDADARERTTTRAGQAVRAGSEQAIGDRELAQWLIIDNQEEVALSEFGQEKAQSPLVKQFAQKMSQEHQAFVQKLQKSVPGLPEQVADLSAPASRTAGFRPQPGQPKPAQSNETNDPKTGQPRPGQTQATAGQQGKSVSLIELKTELAKECLTSSKDALGKHQGKEFDEAFMSQQVMMHMAALATLKTFDKHASESKLKSDISEGIQKTEQHLTEANQIHKQLSQGKAEATRPEAATPERKKPLQP